MLETKAKDPVCGMSVDPSAPRGGSHVHNGVEYFFCNPKCNERFRSEPEKYLSPSYKPGGMTPAATIIAQFGSIHPAAAPVAASVTPAPAASTTSVAHTTAQSAPATPTYICPMCPEVRSPKPDACPSCGMALEPETLAIGARERNTSAPCILRSDKTTPARVPSAAWPWSRVRFLLPEPRTPS